jgi:hypothetical protein
MRAVPIDLVVLSLRRRGASVSEIAGRTGLSRLDVLHALARARTLCGPAASVSQPSSSSARLQTSS